MDLIRVKELVIGCLTKIPKCRESDTYLVSLIWHNHLKTNDKLTHQITGFDLLTMLKEDKLPNYASIIRMRRKLQQLQPELRGPNYEVRKSEETKIKEQLRIITT